MFFYLFDTNRIINLDGSHNQRTVIIDYAHNEFDGNAVVVNGELYVIGEYYRPHEVKKIM